MVWIDEDDAEPERQKYREAMSETDDDTHIWFDDEDWQEEDLPQRPWVAPGYLLRGAVTTIVGPPGVMKSSLMLAWGCSLALGKAHGNFRPKEAGGVIIYNVEDDNLEQKRRLSAALRQFGATPADLKGKLIRSGPSRLGTLFHCDNNGKPSPTKAMWKLREVISKFRPIAVIADPLAELHGCDENNNTAMRAVIAEFRVIAIEFGIAVVLVHHTRKGESSPGDVEAGRGASAMSGASRVYITLNGMREEDAKELDVTTDRKTRALYTRLDDGKTNYSAIDDARWYKKVVYVLKNGEYIPAAEPWYPMDIWDGISTEIANIILDDIDVAPQDELYSIAPNATSNGAYLVVMRRVSGCTEQRARKVIKIWKERGVLIEQKYKGKDRKTYTGCIVNKEKRPTEMNAESLRE